MKSIRPLPTNRSWGSWGRGPSLCAAVFLACSAPSFGAPFDEVRIQTTPVAGRVYMLEGAGGNIGVSVGPDGVLIVDDQFAPLAEKIEAALRDLDKGPLRFVLNTHWHGDHTGGNAHFGQKATLIAHDNVRRRLASGENPSTPREALPVITFDESLSIHFNGEEIRVLHLPEGHTDGDSVIHFTRSGVVHMGDLFFNDRFPFVDLNSGGNVAGYLRNVERVLDRITPELKIIPGHGGLATRADLERFQAMLLATTGLIREGMAAGKSLEALKAAGLPSRWADWGTGFIDTERWIEITYRSYEER